MPTKEELDYFYEEMLCNYENVEEDNEVFDKFDD